MTTVSALSRGFRSNYLDYATLTAQLRAWADAFPSLCKLLSIGKSAEGRDLWVLVVGRDPDRARPAMWIDGNMHAMELTGSSCALAFAEDLLRLHVEGASLGLSPPVQAALAESLVYVMPRMAPDGAEAVLKTGRFVRSSPVDDRPDRLAPRWKLQDVDGDGLCLLMRVEDVAGDFVESKAVPGLMVARTLDDEGPFFKLHPEGVIEGWDGHHVPGWGIFDDNRTDLNRNFPWSWAPEGEQEGAGAYATSTPEARAVTEFTSRSPHLQAWINLHTYGGVYIRPLGHQPDTKMDRDDLEVFRQIQAWVDEHTKYATVSGYEEFLYQPDKPLRGDVSDYAYHQLGCLSLSVELWDLFQQAGLARKKPFIDNYQQQGREDVEKIASWDREKNHGRSIRPWKKVKHPQLGDVEVGGLDPRVGVWNPPYEMLDEHCTKNAAVFARILALLPRLHVDVKREALGGGRSRVEVVVENRGYLPSYGISSAKKLARAEPIHVEIGGAKVLDEPRKNIGHLEGWGHGRFGGASSWPYQFSTGPQTSRKVSFLVEGDGPVTVRAGSCRVGFLEKTA
jgi:hypothetical protein